MPSALWLVALLLACAAAPARADNLEWPSEGWSLPLESLVKPVPAVADATAVARRDISAASPCSTSPGISLLFAQLRGACAVPDAELKFYGSADQAAQAARLKALRAKVNPTADELRERRRLSRIATLSQGMPALTLSEPPVVAVHEGFVAAMQADCGQAAFALAHELGHLERRDLEKGLSFIDVEVKRGQSEENIRPRLVAMSQGNEFAADFRALELVQAAGYERNGAKRLLLRMNNHGDPFHPTGRSRCQALSVLGPCD
ncbi:MAG: hypothetical protein HY927_09405 [Elusimicrobia bacterium]|nr:hypothetical protein [Elusimicrobiota bacterium]